MKKLIAILATAFLALTISSVEAQVVVSENWGNGNPQRRGGGLDDDLRGSTPEEDDLLQSLYNEEEDAELNRILRSEDFIFPSSITDNWHLLFQVGAMNTWGSYSDKKGFGQLTNFAAAISIGKYLTPVNDVRIQLFYGRGTGVRGKDMVFDEYWKKPNTEAGMYEGWDETKEKAAIEGYPTYNFNSLGLSFQWLPNLTNLFMGYEPDRKFTISGMFGIGVEHTFSYTNKDLSQISVWSEAAKRGVPRTLIGLQFGLQADYAINDRWHVNIEAQEHFLDNSFDGLISDNDTWDGHLNLYAGVTWFLKGKLSDGRLQNRNPFNNNYQEIEERIYKNREALDDALVNRPVEVNYVDVTKDVTYTLISFDEGVVEVPRLQQNNVFTTAAAYERYDDAKIFITNANGEDDNIFHERAWSISKLLNNRWQVPLENIWVDANESHIQKLQIPDCKHYIILIIND